MFMKNVGKKIYRIFACKNDRYLGYIDLLGIIDFGDALEQSLLKIGFPITVNILESSLFNNIILVCCLDSIYFIDLCCDSDSNKRYRVIKTLKAISGVHLDNIREQNVYV